MDVNFSGSSSRPESEDVRSEASSDTWDPHEWASCVVTQSQEKANALIQPYWVAPTPSLASAKPTRMQKSITPSTTPTSGKYTTPSRTVSRDCGSERSRTSPILEDVRSSPPRGEQRERSLWPQELQAT